MSRKVKLTKSAISKFIIWGSSRYNEYKKKDVVDLAYRFLKNGGVGGYPVWENRLESGWVVGSDYYGKEIVAVEEYDNEYARANNEKAYRIYTKGKCIVSCGSYCPSSHMGRSGTYLIDPANNLIASGYEDENDNFVIEEKVEFEVAR